MFDALKIAADLLINSSQLVQSWITRLIVVNGSLFSAVGVIISWDHAAKFPMLLRWTLMTICALGLITTALLLGVIVRQNTWQDRYVKKVEALQDQLKVEVQPKRSEVPGGAYVLTFVFVLGLSTIGAWLFLAAIIFEHAPFR